MIQNQQNSIQDDNQEQQQQVKIQQSLKSIACPYRFISGHWLTLARPQYKRTCGISSLVSIWNYQFSRLGLGTKQPICIEQAMLKLNLIGNGSVEERFRKKFKKTAELTEKNQNAKQQEQPEDPQISNINKTLHEYIDSIQFGVFTGNQALMKWIYGGSGRSYTFYQTNNKRSFHQDELSAKRGLVQGLNSGGKTCFIYHAYDHYFCPVGYEFTPAGQQNDEGTFQSSSIKLQDNLCVLVGQSSKMFSCIHSFNWSDIQLDLSTYLPKRFNIRRPKQGVTIVKGKQQMIPNTWTIDCIMAFQKLKD